MMCVFSSWLVGWFCGGGGGGGGGGVCFANATCLFLCPELFVCSDVCGLM
jgi:hypothetical protein